VKLPDRQRERAAAKHWTGWRSVTVWQRHWPTQGHRDPTATLPMMPRNTWRISIIVHWEGNNNLRRTLQSVQALGKRVGVALNPAEMIHAGGGRFTMSKPRWLSGLESGRGGPGIRLLPQTGGTPVWIRTPREGKAQPARAGAVSPTKSSGI
jgi:hypothetical protein